MRLALHSYGIENGGGQHILNKAANDHVQVPCRMHLHICQPCVAGTAARCQAGCQAPAEAAAVVVLLGLLLQEPACCHCCRCLRLRQGWRVAAVLLPTLLTLMQGRMAGAP